MSDTNQIKLPFSAAKLFIKICRAEARVMGTQDKYYADEWAVVCQPSDSRDLLDKFGLITNHCIPTGKGLDLYFKD